MAYTPVNWQTGDTITAAKLNNMEQGIANSGVLRIEATWDDDANGFVLDKTLAEIGAACSSGRPCQIYGAFNSEITVMETPMGPLYAVLPAMSVDPWSTPPILNFDTYKVNESTGVITQTGYQFTLTPAS